MKFLGNNITTLADITSVTAGTGLSGGGTSGAVTLNVDAAQTGITSLGTLTTLQVGTMNIIHSTITAGTPASPSDMVLVATGNDITADTDNFVITSSTGQKPFLELKNTTNDNKGSILQFTKDKGASGGNGDDIGTIFWKGDNDVQQQTFFAKLYAEVSEVGDGDEAGSMFLQVASYDGILTNGIHINGLTEADGEVDVVIASGAASTTTIAGTLTMGSTAALTNAGLVAVANQSNITGLGTITSGVWNGTGITSLGTIATGVWNGDVIASAYLDADTAHLTTAQTFTGSKTMATDVKLNFRDANAYINSPDANDLAIVATSVEIAATDIILDAATKITLENDTDITGELVVGETLDFTASDASISFDSVTILSDSSGTATLRNIDALDATTEATIEAAIDTLGNLTSASSLASIGTISTGVWNATKILRDKTTHSQIVNLKGFCNLLANYQMGEDMQDTQAPFQMAIDYGAATIADSVEFTQKTLFQAGGFHVPFAATINAINVQTTCNNAGTVTIALVEYRPSDAGADTQDHFRTVFHEIAVTSDDSNNKVDTTALAFAALDETAVPAGSHILMMVKGAGDSVGGVAFINMSIELTW